jgi:hypothetical protein
MADGGPYRKKEATDKNGEADAQNCVEKGQYTSETVSARLVQTGTSVCWQLVFGIHN